MANAGSNCFYCPGNGSVWVAPCLPEHNGCPEGVAAGAWDKLPHTKTWSLNIDREDPSKVRTDGTGGARIIACPGFIDGATADVTSVLCKTDYLWCYLFPVVTCGSAWSYLDVADPKELWFYFSYVEGNESDATAGGHPFKTSAGEVDQIGIYGIGAAIPGDVSVDNDSNDPVEISWTVDITTGPFFGAPVGCANVTVDVGESSSA